MTDVFLIIIAVAAIVAAAIVFAMYAACRKELGRALERLDVQTHDADARIERIVSLEKENTALLMQIRGQEELAARVADIHERTIGEMKIQHQKDMELMKEQFKAAAAEITSRNTQEFKEQSAGRIADLLDPIKEKFAEFSKSVNDSRTASAAMKASLEVQIK
ncbi:MAG: hypothetical protein K2H10_05345, partial [Bacteroidales bacterium]|nr:hypothetical protein [Bacteroidales bacterium]